MRRCAAAPLRRCRTLLLPEAVIAEGGRDERPGQHERGESGQDPEREGGPGGDLNRRVRPPRDDRIAQQNRGERPDPLEERPATAARGPGSRRSARPRSSATSCRSASSGRLPDLSDATDLDVDVHSVRSVIVSVAEQHVGAMR